MLSALHDGQATIACGTPAGNVTEKPVLHAAHVSVLVVACSAGTATETGRSTGGATAGCSCATDLEWVPSGSCTPPLLTTV